MCPSRQSHAFMRYPSFVPAIVVLAIAGHLPASAASLENDHIRADFNGSGLTMIHDKTLSTDTALSGDGFSVTLNGSLINSASLTPVIEEDSSSRRVFSFKSGTWTLRAVYELESGWRFVTKHLSITSSAGSTYQLGRLTLINSQLGPAITADLAVRDGRMIRFNNSGMLFTVQNPYLEWTRTGQQIAAAYTPSMSWNPADGAFLTDKVILAPYTLSGHGYPNQIGSWLYVPDGSAVGNPVIDRAEVEAFAGCVKALMKQDRNASERVHVGWTGNDFQIDVATAAGRTEYKRIIDQAAAVGCKHVLYTPANSSLASMAQNTDFWDFENILWLNLGQKIRKDEWTPGVDPLPAEVTEMLDYAGTKGVGLLAYVFPTLPFEQDPAWTNFPANRADTGQRSFQDWMIGKLVDFHAATGISGYSFDHWFINYSDAPSSRYAQWYGCRRILEELRRLIPDVLIDGRQSYHEFGPWSWLGGTYPHPLFSDEQPISFESFPDLHWSRSSADRQRYAAWYFRNVQFCPIELMPGYMTHQTPREDASNVVRRDRFRAKDWDLLGWKYSVISSVATAPFNHVVNLLPARDTEEFAAFTAADRAWMRGWFDWTDEHIETLRNVRPILNQPQLGRVDGTAAFKDGSGFVFLFNPNYRALTTRFRLDSTIGLEGGGPFLLRQLYPDAERGKQFAPPEGTAWHSGDEVILDIPGADALVLEVMPIPSSRPLLFNSKGIVTLNSGRLQISGALGEPGTAMDLTVLLPDSQPVSLVTVNGVTCRYRQQGNTVTVPVIFPGDRFAARQQIGEYDPNFTGGAFSATISIPQRVFQQLADRAAAWPVNYTAQDLQATWLGSDRLLLFVNIADPNPSQPVTLTINGQPKALTPAYSTITGQAPGLSFTGWYADISSLPADTPHTFSVTVPAMAAGRFQGMFFDTVEAGFTGKIESRPAVTEKVSNTDDFGTTHDYLADGTAGSNWSGILTGAGSVPNTGLGGSGAGSTSVASANAPQAGELTVTTTRTDWEQVNNDGFLLYRTVEGDFEAEVHVTDLAPGNFNFGGLMARVPDLAAAGPGEDYLAWGVFDQGGYGNFLRSTAAGVSRDFGVPAGGIARHWLKIVRRGDQFAFYHRSGSGDSWRFNSALDRPDLAGLPLQVGLMHATFSTASLTIRFDEFSLKVHGTPLLLPTPYESWATAIFGADAAIPSVSGTAADPDGDGLNNADEFLALTNPLDGRDFPTITLDSMNGGIISASISGKAGRIYAFDRSSNLADDWIELGRSLLLQSDALQSMLDPSPPPGRAFYRFKIINP